MWPCSQAAVWPCSQPARSICVRRGRGSRVFGQGSVSERPKVQHSKCCVVSQPPWVQIPALPPLPPGPIGAGRFCYAYVACVGGLLPRQISGRRAACPPASRPRRELRSALRLVVRPGPAGLAAASNRSGVSVCCLAWPRRLRAPQPGLPVTSGALHAGGAWALIGGSIRRPETQLWLSTSNFACNSPETLSNHELTTLELQRFRTLLKLLPIELHARFGCGGVVVSRGYRGLALSARCPGGVKPLSPLLACACVGLKPPSPLRVRNERFWRSFRAQRCRRFQRSLVGGVQWCCWFQCRHVIACCARNLSPCSA